MKHHLGVLFNVVRYYYLPDFERVWRGMSPSMKACNFTFTVYFIVPLFPNAVDIYDHKE